MGDTLTIRGNCALTCEGFTILKETYLSGVTVGLARIGPLSRQIRSGRRRAHRESTEVEVGITGRTNVACRFSTAMIHRCVDTILDSESLFR